MTAGEGMTGVLIPAISSDFQEKENKFNECFGRH